MPVPIVSTVFDFITSVADKVIVDKDERERYKMQTAELAQEALKLDQEGRLETERLAIERLRVHSSDRDSARQRESSVKDRTPSILAYSGFGLLVAVVVGLFFIAPPEGNEPILHNLVGIVEGIILSVFAYYFGSSIGSKQKQARIDSLLPGGSSPTEGVVEADSEEKGRVAW